MRKTALMRTVLLYLYAAFRFKELAVFLQILFIIHLHPVFEKNGYNKSRYAVTELPLYVTRTNYKCVFTRNVKLRFQPLLLYSRMYLHKYIIRVINHN